MVIVDKEASLAPLEPESEADLDLALSFPRGLDSNAINSAEKLMIEVVWLAIMIIYVLALTW